MFGNFISVEEVRSALLRSGYIADIGLSTSLFLAMRMGKALFVEGEPGVGKTEIAKVLATLFDTPLIRLQCYEGLDINQAVYEWNYPRQLLELQAYAARNGHTPTPENISTHRLPEDQTSNIFSEKFLLKRPLLQAIDASQQQPPILLIDELDRADEEFESFLLELLGDFQITIPEIGTIKAKHRPITIITSNRTREIHDALKRRCIYYWIDYPTHTRELEIVQLKVPGIEARLATQIVDFVQRLRKEELYKLPGVAETIDWAEALLHLNTEVLSPEVITATLGLLLKYQDDVNKLNDSLVRQILGASDVNKF